MQKDSLKGSMWQSCKDGLESQDIGGKKKNFRSRYFQNRVCMRGGLLITPRPPKSNQMLSFIFMNTNVPNSDKFTCIIEEHVTPDSTETFFSAFAFFLICYKFYETYIFKKFTVMYLLTM